MALYVTIHIVESDYSDLYQEAMLTNYEEIPESSPPARRTDPASQHQPAARVQAAAGRSINRQLELGLLLDSSGAGAPLVQARPLKTFPDCPSVDAANLSLPQLRYCADKLPMDFAHRVNLYQCNVRDIDRLPDPETPYDFVFVRGVWFYCLPAVFEASVARVAQRMAPRGILLVSDPLYRDEERKHLARIKTLVRGWFGPLISSWSHAIGLPAIFDW
ncbi:hypothetical protein ARSEF1564_002003 [Beauveria bassiana]